MVEIDLAALGLNRGILFPRHLDLDPLKEEAPGIDQGGVVQAGAGAHACVGETSRADAFLHPANGPPQAQIWAEIEYVGYVFGRGHEAGAKDAELGDLKTVAGARLQADETHKLRGNAQIDQRVLIGSIQPKRAPFRTTRTLRLLAAVVEKQLVAADEVLLERGGGKIWVAIAREELDAIDSKASA